LISRTGEAQMFVVFTRVDRRPGREGIGCVLVERGAPGFSVTGPARPDRQTRPGRPRPGWRHPRNGHVL